MNALRLAALAALPIALASAQTADDPNEGLRMSIGEAGAGSYNINWWGKSGFHYFIQHSEDLMGAWSYLPVIETGADGVLSYGFTSASPRIFFRLLLTEDNGVDPYSEDYDFDGLTNQQEFDNHTDPFWWDTDHDGIIDGWEVEHGLSATVSNATTDSDGDGSSDLAEYYQNTDPHALNPVGGVSIAITGLSEPESSSAITVGPTGAAIIRDGGDYRYWNAGQLSSAFSSVVPPPPEIDNDPLTYESYAREERFWINNQGWAVQNILSSDFFYDDGPYGWDSESFEINKQLDTIKIVNPTSQTATECPLTTHTWTALWDGYAFPVYNTMRIGKVHGIDNNGYIWAKLEPAPNWEPGIYKIPVDNPAAAQLTDYDPYRFRGVSRNGVTVGTLNSQTGYYDSAVGGVLVDYEALFVGEGNAIFGKKNDLHRVYFPDSVELAAPEFDGYWPTSTATHFDRWNRLHGTYIEAGQSKRAVWERKQNEDLSYSWERKDYKTLILGGGKWTDHQVPPGPWEPQGGLVSWLDDDGNYHNAPTVFVPGSLAVDGNRDGVIRLIEDDESDGTYPKHPLICVVNSDNDRDASAVTATEGTDCENTRVDGASDLADFFPVFLDIKNLLEALPPSDTVKYKLKEASGALNFAFTSLTRPEAFLFRTATSAGGYGPDQGSTAKEAPTHQITAEGVDIFALSPGFIDRIKNNGQGVIIIEARGPSPALSLVVERDSNVLAEMKISLLPMEVGCAEIYTFGGHKNDVIELCKTVGTPCEWKLKNATPVIGTFSNPSDTACNFTATTPGVNIIQLSIGGTVVWEKTTEVVNIISRTAWGAYAADPSKLTTTPTLNGITFHHSSNTADGAAEVLRIQDMHMQISAIYWPRPGDGWGDIGYHYIMDKAGNVYQGRDPEATPGKIDGPYTLGSHVENNNTASGIGICVLGDYEGAEAFPASRQKSLEKAITAIARRYKLTSDKVSYHQARAITNPTECPGSNIIPKAPEIINNIGDNLK